MATKCFYLAVPSGKADFSFARLQKALPAFAASVSDEECRFEHQGEYVFLKRLNYIPSDLEDEDFQLPKGVGCFNVYWVEFNGSDAFDIVLRTLIAINSHIFMSSDWFSGAIADHKYPRPLGRA